MNNEATQKECDEYVNRWVMANVSALSRMTKLSTSKAHQLYLDACKCRTTSHMLDTLETFGIPRTSLSARQVINYWNNADNDER